MQIVDGGELYFPPPPDPFDNEVPADLPHTKHSERLVESRPPVPEELLSTSILSRHGDRRT